MLRHIRSLWKIWMTAPYIISLCSRSIPAAIVRTISTADHTILPLRKNSSFSMKTWIPIRGMDVRKPVAVGNFPPGQNGNPPSGHTGTHIVGYNLTGTYQNNLPATYMTTTSFDCTNASEVYLSFWRWLGVESSYWDQRID